MNENQPFDFALPPTPGQQYYHPREFFTITELVSFSRCPFLYFLNAGCFLKQRGPAINLVYGEAIHAAVPHLHEGDGQAIDRAMAAFDKVWVPSGLEELQDKKMNRTIARELLENFSSGSQTYDAVQLPRPFEVREEISPYEVPFSIDIGLPIPLQGRMDGVAKLKATGTIWTLEYKTTSELGERFFDSFAINAQTIGYTTAARLTFPSIDFQGSILHGLFKSNVNQKHLALPIPVSKLQQEWFLRWAHWIGGQILECERTRTWSQDLSACNQVGQHGLPGFNCRYLDLCRNYRDWTEGKDLFIFGDQHKPFTPVGK